MEAAYSLSFKAESWGRLAFHVRWDDEVPGVMRSPKRKRRTVGLNQIAMRYSIAPDERVYGLGEQFSSLEHNGRRVPVLTGEQGIG